MNQDIIQRLERFEQQNRALHRRLRHQNLLWGVLVASAAVLAFGSIQAADDPASNPAVADRVVAKEVVIVDDAGTVRARLGGDLPNAVIDGRVLDRGGEAAGLLIYDKDGTERGGYVTQHPGDHAMLTLDGKQDQVVLFAAAPDGTTVLTLRNGDDSVALRADAHGAHMTVVDDGQVVFQQPEVTMPSEACAAYRTGRATHTEQEVLSACQSRFETAACHACLEEPD